jgi:hypothetical protein
MVCACACYCRLHRHVYDRLAAAQRCARDKNQPQFRQTGDEHRKEPDPQVRLAGVLHMLLLGMLHALAAAAAGVPA